MSFVRWCVKNPYAVLAFYASLTLLILWAIFYRLPIRMMPYVEQPLVGVVAKYHGLSAEEMELYVTKPIEERMVDLRNVRYIRSFSQDGMALVTVQFQYDRRDMKKALFDVQQMVNTSLADLPYDPANFKPPYVLLVDPLNMPVLTLNVEAPNWDHVRLREFLDNTVVNRIKTVDHVESVFVFGGYKRQMQIVVDRDKLGAYGLSILDVQNAIDMNNVSHPAGRLTQGENESIVRVDSNAETANEVLDYPLTAVGDRVVYIRDVARVLDTYEERRSAYHYNGQPGISLNVIQEPDASSPKVIAGLRKALRDIEASYPGVRFEEAWDYGHFVTVILRHMFEELGLAVLLTGLVILFFLGDVRGTVISLTTIPLTLGWSILLLVPMGMSLNSSSLIGLVIAIGRLVDDSIIDIHAVRRHLNMGKPPEDAAVEGVMEVRRPVLVTTTMMILGLLPMLFCGGVTQEMFVGLTWPIVFAMITSCFISFTLTPVLCARLLHARNPSRRPNALERYALRPFGRGLDRVSALYGRALRWSLRWRPVVLAIGVCTIIAGIFIYPSLGYEMMPLSDVGSSIGFLEMEPGTSFERTEEATTQLEQVLMDVGNKHGGAVKRVSTQVGMEPGGTHYTGYSMGLVNSAALLVTFSDMDERKVDIWTMMDEVHDRAEREISGMRRVSFKAMGSDVMATARAPVDIGIYGPDLGKLAEYGDGLLKIARGVDGLYQPGTSWSMTLPQIHVNVDRAKAAELGLSPMDIARQCYYAVNGGLTTEFYRRPNVRQNTIQVRYEEGQRGTETDLALAKVKGMTGQGVPLLNLVTLERRPGPTVIEHDMMRRCISVSGYYHRGDKDEMALGMELQGKARVQLGIEPGYGTFARGEMSEMMSSLKRINNGLMAGIVIMLLMLIAQFRSIRYPVVHILSVPLVITGAFLALKLSHMTLSSVSVFAFVILAGQDVTIATLLVDMMLHDRQQGMNTNEAILHTGPVRLTPILMTSATAIAALAPVALHPAAGVDAYQPMAVAVMGGFASDLVLCLLFVPVCFAYADTAEESVRAFFRRLLRRQAASGEEGSE